MRFSLKTIAMLVFCIAISAAWYADRSRLAERLRQVKLDLHIATLEYELDADREKSARLSAMSRLEILANSEVEGFEAPEILTRTIPMLINALDDHELRIAIGARSSLETIATRLDAPLDVNEDAWGRVGKDAVNECWIWYENLLAEIEPRK